jgi:hypothetical protein
MTSAVRSLYSARGPDGSFARDAHVSRWCPSSAVLSPRGGRKCALRPRDARRELAEDGLLRATTTEQHIQPVEQLTKLSI